MLPGRKSGFRAGFEPYSNRARIKISSPAGRRADFERFPTRIWPKSGPEARLPARLHHCVTYGTNKGVVRKNFPLEIRQAPSTRPTENSDDDRNARTHGRPTLCHTILLPGFQSGEPQNRRPAGGPILVFCPLRFRPQSGPGTNFRPGSTIV